MCMECGPQVCVLINSQQPSLSIGSVGTQQVIVVCHFFFFFRIDKDITVIGRNPSSSDIFLDSNKNKVMISRLHARIVTEKDDTGKHAFRISDTSLNGTFVNDVKIADSCDLHPGDTVTFGHLRGAILNPGILAQQPDSEFRFTVSGCQKLLSHLRQHTCTQSGLSQSFEVGGSIVAGGSCYESKDS